MFLNHFNGSNHTFSGSQACGMLNYVRFTIGSHFSDVIHRFILFSKVPFHCHHRFTEGFHGIQVARTSDFKTMVSNFNSRDGIRLFLVRFSNYKLKLINKVLVINYFSNYLSCFFNCSFLKNFYK